MIGVGTIKEYIVTARLYQQSSQDTYFFVCVKSNNYRKEGRPSFFDRSNTYDKA